jgi:hypothetical protein
MAVDASPYAALGLEPGADAASIERAYKRLIKQFHPDREGGDAKRAAEINRAYRELRNPEPSALDLDDYGGFGRRGSRWVRAALWLVSVGMLVVIVTGTMQGMTAAPIAGVVTDPRAPKPIAPDLAEDPIAFDAANDAIAQAMRLAGQSDELALAETSRECHRKMRQNPTLAMLDRCAAFDDAVAQLQDRDPWRDRGPFSELAVTGRKMSAATLLSNDYLAIDSRLDRIRLHVELALAAQRPPLPPLEINEAG